MLAKEAGLEEGTLTGFLSNIHFYENQKDGVHEILGRDSDFDLPKINTENLTSIFDWEYTQSKLDNYQALSNVVMPIAV